MLLLIILSGVFFIVASLMPAHAMAGHYAYLGYYICWILVICWGSAVYHFLRKDGAKVLAKIRGGGLGIFGCLLLACFIFTTLKPALRVLSDETNLLNMSKTMHAERSVAYPVEGKFYDGEFHGMFRTLDKRPLLFPFAVHLLHHVRGYHAENAYIFNFLVFFALLCMVCLFLTRFIGVLWALLICVLTTAQPIIQLVATSAGFELFQVFFMVLSLISIYAYLRKQTPERFGFAWMNLVMLSNIRYESIAFFAIALLCMFLYKKLARRYVEESLIYWLTPILLLPIAWARQMGADTYEIKDGSPFGLNFILPNWKAFATSFFRLDFEFPYAGAINLFGLIALLYLFIPKMRQKKLWAGPVNQTCLIGLTWVTFQFALYMIFFLGRADMASQLRFWVPQCLTLSVLTGLLLHKLFEKGRLLPRLAGVLITCALFLLYQPVARSNALVKSLSLPHEHEVLLNYLNQNFDQNILLVYDRPNDYIAHGYGAVSFGTANEFKEELLEEFTEGRYSEIIVAERRLPKSGMLYDPDHQMDAEYELEKIVNLTLKRFRMIRISRVLPISSFPEPTET